MSPRLFQASLPCLKKSSLHLTKLFSPSESYHHQACLLSNTKNGALLVFQQRPRRSVACPKSLSHVCLQSQRDSQMYLHIEVSHRLSQRVIVHAQLTEDF